MMNTQKVLAAAAILAAAGTTFAQADILLYSEGNDPIQNERVAADNLGLVYDHIVRDTLGLNTALASGQYTSAIIHQPANNFAAGFPAELDAFVGAGNVVHFSFWNTDAEPAIQATLGVASAFDFFIPRPVFNSAAHPSWGGATSPVTVDPAPSPWNDNGDAMTAAVGGSVVSTFDSVGGDGATIVANSDRTLTNGFEYDSMLAGEMIGLLENQIAWVLNAPPPPASILVFSSSNDFHEQTAADNLGLTYDFNNADFVALNADLNNGQYGFAVIHNPCCNFEAGFDTELTNFVDAGNRVHFSFWNTDADPAIQAAMGIDSAADFFVPRPVFDNAGHPSWGGAASPVTVDPAPSPWNDNGDSLTGDEVVSTFDSAAGDGATVVSNENRTLANGFEYDSMDETGVVALLEAQIDWVRNSAPPPPPPGELVVQFQSGNDGHLAAASATAGITPDLDLFSDFPGLTSALMDPSYGVALISNPCCFFDAGTPGALADFIAAGNVAHMSFWDMDGDPVLQDAFGVASAVDFFLPRSVHNNVAHPSWGAAADVFPAIDPSPWADNGDSMTAAAGGTVVGTHDFAGGDGAIIVANSDRTLFNGFDYDSLTDGEIRDLLAAQLGWLPSPGGGCVADCDGSGSLDLFDFLCFQNLFDAGDLAADLDGDGVLTLFDFLAFQNAFDAGCE